MWRQILQTEWSENTQKFNPKQKVATLALILYKTHDCRDELWEGPENTIGFSPSFVKNVMGESTKKLANES